MIQFNEMIQMVNEINTSYRIMKRLPQDWSPRLLHENDDSEYLSITLDNLLMPVLESIWYLYPEEFDKYLWNHENDYLLGSFQTLSAMEY